MTDLSCDPRNFIDRHKFPKLQTLQVKASASFIRRSPRPSSSAETEILHGTLFHVHRLGRGWVWGQAECLLPGISYPDYVGWCRIKDLSDTLALPSHKVTTLGAPVFKGPDIKSPVQRQLSLGATITAKKHNDVFYETGNGFMHSAHLHNIEERPPYGDWIEVVESLLGRPYIWGGVSSAGLDCSGLVQTSLRMFGSDAPRDSDQQAQMGQAIPIKKDLSGLQRGDLVFWKGHVGVMMSPTRLLHANAWHMMVASEPLKTAVSRIEKQAGAVTAIRRLS